MTPDGVCERIKSSGVLIVLRAVVRYFRKDNLGFADNKVGTHSIRSSATMLMYLNSVPVYTIMLASRWSSEAFLLYIRKQVLSFTKGISNRMLLTEEFYTAPDNNAVDREDPRILNNPNSFAIIHGPTQSNMCT